MDLRFEDGELKLVPEDDADRAKIAAAFGEPDLDRPDSFGGLEFRGPAFGKDITLRPDGSVNVSVREAWWNHDSILD